MMNGFSHHYQLDESTFIFRGVRSDFYFLSHFSMKFLCAKRIAPDGPPRFAASHRGLVKMRICLFHACMIGNTLHNRKSCVPFTLAFSEIRKHYCLA